MKIVFIGCRDINLLGGIESYMANLSAELVNLGHSPIIYCESDRNSIEIRNGVKIIHMKGPKSNIICKPWVGLKATLRTIIKEKNVSIIHYNAWPPSLWCFIPRLFGVKSLMQGHGLEWQRSKYSLKQQKIMKFMEMLTAYMNQHLIMCSEEQTKYFKETYDKSAVTIPTAVNIPQNNREQDLQILEDMGLQHCKYVLFMARLVQDKNPDFLIRGFKNFKKSSHIDMKLVIAGSNEADFQYVDKLHRLAGNDKSIIFTGAIYGEKKEVILRNAYVFCLPSTIEGLSIGLLEAMSYKLPIIASDIKANRELLGDDAVWVNPENVDDISDAITFCVENKDIIDGFRSKNFNKVINNYTWDKVAQKYVSYLYSIGAK